MSGENDLKKTSNARYMEPEYLGDLSDFPTISATFERDLEREANARRMRGEIDSSIDNYMGEPKAVRRKNKKTDAQVEKERRRKERLAKEREEWEENKRREREDRKREREMENETKRRERERRRMERKSRRQREEMERERKRRERENRRQQEEMEKERRRKEREKRRQEKEMGKESKKERKGEGKKRRRVVIVKKGMRVRDVLGETSGRQELEERREQQLEHPSDEVLRSVEIWETSRALSGYTKSFVIQVVDSSYPRVQLRDTINAIRDRIRSLLDSMRGLKFMETLRVTFKKLVGDDENLFKTAYFNCKVKTIIGEHDIIENLRESREEILNRIDVWISEGSGWVIESIDGHYLNVVEYRPFRGSSYIELARKV